MGVTTLLRSVLAGALGLSLAACATTGAAPSDPVGIAAPVRTGQGLIQGAPGKVDGVTVFRNIPFAAPPVGALRFAQPQPALAWEGVRDGTRYGDVCMQNP